MNRGPDGHEEPAREGPEGLGKGLGRKGVCLLRDCTESQCELQQGVLGEGRNRCEVGEDASW